jgi:ActR/RegA family two-component response regulator
MGRIVYLAEDKTLASAVWQALSRVGSQISVLPAAYLSDTLRDTIRQLEPDLFLLDLASGLSNTPMFFFLRADSATRTIPICVLGYGPLAAQHAAALGADGFVRLPASADEILECTLALMPHPIAREVGASLHLSAALPG